MSGGLSVAIAIKCTHASVQCATQHIVYTSRTTHSIFLIIMSHSAPTVPAMALSQKPFLLKNYKRLHLYLPANLRAFKIEKFATEIFFFSGGVCDWSTLWDLAQFQMVTLKGSCNASWTYSENVSYYNTIHSRKFAILFHQQLKNRLLSSRQTAY